MRTEQQSLNLAKLALGLVNVVAKLPEERFTMRTFTAHRSCGTIHCACGWGPELVAPMVKEDKRSYLAYGERVFGIEYMDHMSAWDWCFSAEWGPVDNTVGGAAARILYLLKHDSLPDGWGYDPETVALYTPRH